MIEELDDATQKIKQLMRVNESYHAAFKAMMQLALGIVPKVHPSVVRYEFAEDIKRIVEQLRAEMP